ncbi:MAG: hypothetical protein ACI8YQ_001028 [Polaribacter sp.]|jgi:hypothetical protein
MKSVTIGHSQGAIIPRPYTASTLDFALSMRIERIEVEVEVEIELVKGHPWIKFLTFARYLQQRKAECGFLSC